MERRCLQRRDRVQIRQEAEGSPTTVYGYAAVFYREGDPATEYVLNFWGMTIRERIMPTAFTRAVQEDDVRCLFNHDANHLLGRTKSKTLRLSVDDVGLLYEVDLPETRTGQEVAESVRRGDLDGSSFGFVPVKTALIEQEGSREVIREIHEVTLYDVSPVVFPAYPGTTAGTRATGDLEELKAELERFRDATLARKAAAIGLQARAQQARLGE